MSDVSALIVGCGDVGSRLARQLLAQGWQVSGLRRSVDQLPEGVRPIAADLAEPQIPSAWPEQGPDYLVYCVAASQHDAAGYQAAYVEGLRHVLGWLAAKGQRPRRLVFVSSSSVYAQQDGEWIAEAAATQPEGYSGKVMLEAERLALGSGIPATIVRLTGIYGPGREWLLSQVRQGYRVAEEPPLYGNRIHAEDAACLIAHLLQADARGVALDDCYIGVDDDPAPLAEVVAWLREYLGVTQWSDEQRVRRTGSKRCSNARARALGWVPMYPSYKEGYAAILQGRG
ncbi:SDR family oxidoreductase [Pseudomonas mosselii]|uniref:SDR family oxidoreductase n=1 Tax=Pseudomonas mosselii TaxID=78327 RepID=UPI0007702549|nr:SDR family oxidoreductase [Pseudomonas mosselii]AMK33581.1 Nucleoside-diphosphate-sugar epimerase [Pseudomonas putida]MBC3453405.1 SDR family oxidoreductase [Pseudomonas mosselii]MDH1529949.1 SDR family oxidoreductase [Pseudomonas mosselii]MDH1657408.1 SDR family oxidoreductase [Pseudomonas mosselii]MDH1715997.1 SDR family oxidoreductase [Pseudomonas mosselii]